MNSANQRILAGIVLYNAEIERLSENIGAILPQVERLVLVDNGSDSDDFMALTTDQRITVIRLGKNKGIATALNTILQYALDNDFDWALTLDHDSVVSPGLVEAYRGVIPGKERLGMVCCKIHDRNATMQRVEAQPQQDGYIVECITSASMVRVEAWQDVGGFDDAMFIDSVDTDFCRMLIARGWTIFRTYRTELLHEVGRSRVIRIFGKEYLSLNHSPFRYYYIVRNNIYLGRKHHTLLRCLLVSARSFWTVARYESNRRAKLARMVKGFVHGFTMPVSKPQKRVKSCG